MDIDTPMDWGVELGWLCLIGLTGFGMYVLWKTMTRPLI